MTYVDKGIFVQINGEDVTHLFDAFGCEVHDPLEARGYSPDGITVAPIGSEDRVSIMCTGYSSWGPYDE